ncbi:MAG: hypothetical protein JWO38_3378 [Gemmataceae bacterium]|nr:hypothetical protein [Gemmataceae bacterium]
MGMSEDGKFGDGYDAIFGKGKGGEKKTATKPAKKTANKPAGKKAGAKKK